MEKLEINWVEAPKWANFCAMDANGYVYWFEIKPKLREFAKMWVKVDGKSALLMKLNPDSINWMESLTYRLKNSETTIQNDEEKTQFCCEVLEKLNIGWMVLENGDKCLPYIRGHSDENMYKVNYCPSCGKYIRGLVINRKLQNNNQ